MLSGMEMYLGGMNCSINARRDRVVNAIALRCDAVAAGYETPCYEWTGPGSGKPGRGRAKGRGHSYPRMNLDGHTVAAHRALWVTLNGYLPSKKQLDHLCKNRACVRPDHLEPVTHKTNQKRRDRK